MFHLMYGLFAAVAENTSQPLSFEFPYAEILHLVQVAIFAGIVWLINEMKKSKGSNDTAHETVLTEVEHIKKAAIEVTETLESFEKRFDELEKSV